MVLTYQEALGRLGSRYAVRKAVAEGRLHRQSRGVYSTEERAPAVGAIAAKHPGAVLSGATALYFHGFKSMRADSRRKMAEFDLAGDPYILGTQEPKSRPYNPTQIGKDFAAFCKMDGCSCTFHDLRRTFAAMMIATGTTCARSQATSGTPAFRWPSTSTRTWTPTPRRPQSLKCRTASTWTSTWKTSLTLQSCPHPASASPSSS